jgi:hypothetical protein
MKEVPRQVERYGLLVWENPTAEAIRKEECLCLNCGRMKPGQPDHCQVAAAFYEICKVNGNAFVLSRCAHWNPKGK